VHIVIAFVVSAVRATFLAILANVLYIIGFVGVDATPAQILAADLPLSLALGVLALGTVIRSMRRATPQRKNA